MATNREFLVGATVNLTVSVSKPGTRVPVDPGTGVSLVSLKVGTSPVTLTDTDFAKVTEGEYLYRLETEDFAPGVYTWLARALDPVLGGALVEDNFVLRQPL